MTVLDIKADGKKRAPSTATHVSPLDAANIIRTLAQRIVYRRGRAEMGEAERILEVLGIIEATL